MKNAPLLFTTPGLALNPSIHKSQGCLIIEVYWHIITVEEYDLPDSKSDLTVPWNKHWPGRDNFNSPVMIKPGFTYMR